MKKRYKVLLFACFIENPTAFFNKTYRERYNFKLLDTCLWQTGNFNSKPEALLT